MPWHNFLQVVLLCHTPLCLSTFINLQHRSHSELWRRHRWPITASSLSARSSTLFLFLFLVSSYNLFSNTEQTFLEQTHIIRNTVLILTSILYGILYRPLSAEDYKQSQHLSSVTKINKFLFFNLHSISEKWHSHLSIALTYTLSLGWTQIRCLFFL